MRIVALLAIAARLSFGQISPPPTNAPSGAAGGNLSGTYPNPTVAKINGTTVAVNSAANQVALTTAAAVTAWTGIPSCQDTVGQHLNFNTTTHAFSCGTSSAGGSLTVGTTPIISGTDGLLLLQSSSKLSQDSTLHYYPSGIPDPSSAPPVAVHGTADGTSYGYVVFERIGPSSVDGIIGSTVAATLPSPTRTVTSNSTLDSTNYNSITVPTVSDPNVACHIVRVAGPQSPQRIRTLACNGSTWNDQDVGSADGFVLPTLNTTAGISIQGGFISTGGFGISTFASSGVITSDEGGNGIGFFYQIDKNGTWLMYNGASALQDMWFAGWATALTSVDNTNTPYQITVSDGTIKCDATTGNRTVTLPDPSTNSEFLDNDSFGLGRFARYYVVHKVDSSSNTCTVTASAGTTIDGAATYVLTQPHESVTVYWDGASWPTSNRLNFSKVLGTVAASQLPDPFTATNCSSSASPAVCASAAAGSVAIPTGTNPTLVVNTTKVTANSQILLQSDDTLGTKLSTTCNSTLASLAAGIVVTARTAGTSFTITFNGVLATNPLCLSYAIIN